MSDTRSESFECPRGIDAGAFALRALTDAEGAEYAEHLGHCAACTAEVHVLRSVVDTLPIAAPQVAPSSALKSRIMAVVAAESELLRAAGSETDRAVVPSAPRRRWQSFVPSLRPALAGALACALLAVGVVGGLAMERAGKPETRTLSAWAAGEADAAERVLEAGRLGARRIGHGVRLVDALHSPAGPDLLAEARELGLHLEVCPSSNVHTGAARSVASHPITALWRAGVSLSYHTDNRLMSSISLAEEAAALLAHTPLTETDLLQMALQAAGHSFLPAPARAAAGQAVRQWAQGRGLALQ